MTIANVFSQMGLVESWGSGIRRILSAAEEYKLPVPKVEVFDDMLRVNLYRNAQVKGTLANTTTTGLVMGLQVYLHNKGLL